MSSARERAIEKEETKRIERANQSLWTAKVEPSSKAFDSIGSKNAAQSR